MLVVHSVLQTRGGPALAGRLYPIGMISAKSLCWLVLSAALIASPAFPESGPGPARLVDDLTPGSASSYLGLRDFTQIGNRSVFLRGDDEHRLALWVTDGTAEGTGELAVLCPPCDMSGPLGSAGNIAFYYTATGLPDSELTVWRTDGTPAGTFPLTAGISSPSRLPVASIQGGMLFFLGCAIELGCELWASDGSLAGTGLAGETLPGPPSANVRHLAATGDSAFLIAEVPGEPSSLWVANGRARTLRRVATVPEARALAATAGQAFFIAQADGLEVWTSDGSAKGTRAVTGFAPRNPFPPEPAVTLLDGRAWFRANDGKHGFELWSAGAKPGSVARITNLPRQSGVEDFAKAGDRIVFAARPRTWGWPLLWSSRGDHRSSAPLAGCPGGCPGVVGPLARLDSGKVVFYGSDPQGGGLWVTDGTAAGTRLLQRTVSWSLSQAVPLGGLALIQVMEEYEVGELWVTDGTAEGTLLVARGGPYWSHYYGWAGRLQAGAAGGRLVFPGSSNLPEIFDEMLWRSDGTPAGSSPLLVARTARSTPTSRPVRFQDGLLVITCVSDDGETVREELRLVQGTGSTSLVSASREAPYCHFSAPVALEDTAVFIRTDGGMTELWRTDGTPEGTEVLLPGTGGIPADPVRFGDEIAFQVWYPLNGTFRSEIWLTDGTPEGTRKQLGLPDGTGLSLFTAAGGRLWFFDLIEGGSELRLQLWVSDATPAGTHPVTAKLGDTFLATAPFVEAGGRVWFLFREEGEEALEIWSSDGTPEGTGPAVTAASGMVDPQRLTAAQDRLYFLAARADDPRGRLRPWVSDGTDAGTVLLADAEIPDDQYAQFERPDSYRFPFVEFAGRVWFAARDRQHGTELWSTDGTPGGTSRLLDIAPGLLGSYPRYLTVWDGRLWFAARDGVHGMELWSSDGTAEGTRMVQDIYPGPSWSMPVELTPTEGGLFFSANDGQHGREFWVVP